ncbi:MAG: SLOG family protein [Streptosporangiaceae bacterium]
MRVPQMRPPFRLLVTGSRTWDDSATIGQALVVILDRHPGGVLLVHGAHPRGADAIAAAYAARTPATRSRRTRQTGTVTAGAPGIAATPMITLGADGMRGLHPGRQPRQHRHRPARGGSRRPYLAPHTPLTGVPG